MSLLLRKMESVIQPTALPRNNYIVSQAALNFIAACVIGVRLGANWSHHKKFFADDCKSSFAVIVRYLLLLTACNPDICVVGLIFVAGFSVTSSMLASGRHGIPLLSGCEINQSASA